MKKNLQEILNSITPDTPLEEVAAYCDNIEDFELIFASLPEIKSKPVQLSAEIKQAALSLVKTNKLNAAEITTSYLQRNLPVTYPQAETIVISHHLRNFLLAQAQCSSHLT